MSTVDPVRRPSRLERRKARTRAALIRAAQGFIAQGRLNVPISDITETADVANGSFYNYFETKEELFRAAVDEVLERYGELLDHLTVDLSDPAEVFCQSVRLTGRLHRREPQLSLVLLNSGPSLFSIGAGLAPRALRDIKAGVEAGRFSVLDPDLAVTIVVGAMISLGQLLHDQPARRDDEAVDQVVEQLLRVLGVSDEEARELCERPLPDLEVVLSGGSAAE